MALTKAQKKDMLDELKSATDGDQTVTFVSFDRLPVHRISSLRDDLYEEDVTFKVVKKSLLQIALNESDTSGEIPELPGQIAITYGGGVTAAARGVYQFDIDEEAEEKLEIVGGIFDGELKDQEKMLEIAQIPGTDELRGMFANVISSPISGFAITLDQRAQKLN